MRKHRVLYYSLIAVALVFVFGVVTAVLSIKNDYMNKFYISCNLRNQSYFVYHFLCAI